MQVKRPRKHWPPAGTGSSSRRRRRTLDSLDANGSALRLRGSLANPDSPRLWRRELDETVTIAMARPIFGESVVLIGNASWGSAFHAPAFEPVIGIV